MLHGEKGTGYNVTGKNGTGESFHIGTFIRSVDTIMIKRRHLNTL